AMGNRASHEDRVQHVRQIEIGDELPAPCQQPLLLARQQRPADKRGCSRSAHWRGSDYRRRWSSISSALLPVFLSWGLRSRVVIRLTRYAGPCLTRSNHSSSESTATPRS